MILPGAAVGELLSDTPVVLVTGYLADRRRARS
jgi:hypothetical protein